MWNILSDYVARLCTQVVKNSYALTSFRFNYIIYFQPWVFICIYDIYSYIYSIYTLYMKFEISLYICIYTLYMKFCDFVYIHVYIQHWPLQNWNVPILLAEINIDCLSVYMIYTIFVYMMYIYTVYEFLKNLYICIYTHVYENCIYCIYSVYIHAIYTLFVYIIYTYRHPRLKTRKK